MWMPRLALNPPHHVLLLGLTQIIGYGTLYYSVAILAESVAAELGWPLSWIYASFSIGLLAGGLVSPFAGRLFDRLGAAHVMSAGSVICALAVGLAAVAQSGIWFAACLIAFQVAGSLVFYDAAFVALAQVSGGGAALRILQLTLIAGFASTLFWPLTGWLNAEIGWRLTLLLYAALNLLIAAPVHRLLALSRRTSGEQDRHAPGDEVPAFEPVPARIQRRIFVLVSFGFAATGFALSAVLAQLVPVLKTLGFGEAALAVSMCFGPAQVVIRFANLVAGGNRHPIMATLVAVFMLPAAMLLLVLTAPNLAGAFLFAVFLGFYSGLTSIVSGTLPLALFGAQDFGARLGNIALFRKVLGAVAPFVLAWLIERQGATPALLVLVAVAALGAAAFVGVWRAAAIRFR
ncbi:MAG: MFS transporter [Aestuariivirga sp.]